MSERIAAAMWIDTAVGTWIGQRSANEDRVYSDGSMVALFDGIGGRAFGDVAASVALAEVVKSVAVGRLTARSDVDTALRAADEAVRVAGASVGVQIGTTAVVAIVELSDQGAVVHLGWAGDSAALLLRGDGILALVGDNTDLLHDQRPGLATWLGSGEHLPPRHSTHALLPHDTLILLSDGITDVMTHSAIGWLAGSAATPRQAVDKILNAAQAKGAADNCSVAVARIKTMSQSAAGQRPAAGAPIRSTPVPQLAGPAGKQMWHQHEDLTRTVEDDGH